MRAARMFAGRLRSDRLLSRTAAVRVELFGSLGATGHGHGTVKAVPLGLAGHSPRTVDPEAVGGELERIRESGRLRLLGEHEIAFRPDDDVVLHRRQAL